jgi:hypothetical protein
MLQVVPFLLPPSQLGHVAFPSNRAWNLSIDVKAEYSVKFILRKTLVVL